jgi:hypothetical protein
MDKNESSQKSLKVAQEQLKQSSPDELKNEIAGADHAEPASGSGRGRSQILGMNLMAARSLIFILILMYFYVHSLAVAVMVVSGGVFVVMLIVWVKRVLVDKREGPFSPASGYLWMGLSLAAFMTGAWYVSGGAKYFFP